MLNEFYYKFYMVAAVNSSSRCGHTIEVHHRHQPNNNNKLALYIKPLHSF